MTSTLRDKGIIKPTLLFGLITIILFWFLVFQHIMLPPEFSRVVNGFDVSQLFLPLLSLTVANYASVLVSKLMEGRLVEPVSRSFKNIGLGVTVFLVLAWPQTPPIFSVFLTLPLELSLIASAFSLSATYFSQYRELIEPVIKGLVLIYVTLLLSQNWGVVITTFHYDQSYTTLLLRSTFSEGALIDLGSILVYSLLFTAFSSIMGLLKLTGNAYVAYLGNWVSSGLDKKFYLYTFIVAYFIYGRGPIQSLLGANQGILPIAEWGLVCFAFFQLYKTMNHSVSSLVVQRVNDEKLIKHFQEIKYVSDQKMDELSKLIIGFQEYGEKSMLIVNLADMLLIHGYSSLTINQLLQPLIDYKDLQRGSISFYWLNKKLDLINRERREILVRNTLESFEKKGLFTSIKEPETVEVGENI